jgi:hypothetical protein
MVTSGEGGGVSPSPKLKVGLKNPLPSNEFLGLIPPPEKEVLKQTYFQFCFL